MSKKYKSKAKKVDDPSATVPPQIGLFPPRGTAFQAPFVDLQNPFLPTSNSEGLSFSFEPKANYITDMSFTIEPRKKKTEAWKTMMRCGFVPIVQCQVPPYAMGNYTSHPLTIQNPPQFYPIQCPPPPAQRKGKKPKKSKTKRRKQETSSSSMASSSSSSEECLSAIKICSTSTSGSYSTSSSSSSTY